MKYIPVLFVAVAVLSVLCLAEATPRRNKRALATGHCPDKMTDDECMEYARKEVKDPSCLRISVKGGVITWASCGSVGCSGEGIMLSKEDLSKPYPECCPKCVPSH